jgi:hydrogenase maturation protease
MKAVVIGIGSKDRHDAGVGPEVIDRLADLRLRDLSLAVVDDDPAQLDDLWSDVDVGVLVDTARNEPSRPGKIHELIVDNPAPGQCRSAASPGLQLTEVIDVALALGRTPRRLVILAVEGSDFTPGRGLTHAVAATIDRVVRLAAQEAVIALTRATPVPQPARKHHRGPNQGGARLVYHG